MDHPSSVVAGGRGGRIRVGKNRIIRRLLNTRAVSTAALRASESAQLQAGIHGDHLGEDLQHLLGDGLVVYRDQVLGLGVDLQGLVEAQSSLNAICNELNMCQLPMFSAVLILSSTGISGRGTTRTFRAQGLSAGNLAHEISLLLLEIGREAFILGLLHGLLDGFTLRSSVSLYLFLDSSGHPTVVFLEGFPELGVGLSLVVKVHGVRYRHRTRPISNVPDSRRDLFRILGHLPRRPVTSVPAEAATKVDVFMMQSGRRRTGA